MPNKPSLLTALWAADKTAAHFVGEEMPKGYPLEKRKPAATVALKAHNDVKAAMEIPRGNCSICITRPCMKSYVNKFGKTRYRNVCSACWARAAKERAFKKHGRYMCTAGKKKYTKIKKDHCEGCGFKANYACQLHVDHIDGNHKNDSPDNLWTLCANCHAEKTWLFDQNGAI